MTDISRLDFADLIGEAIHWLYGKAWQRPGALISHLGVGSPQAADRPWSVDVIPYVADGRPVLHVVRHGYLRGYWGIGDVEEAEMIAAIEAAGAEVFDSWGPGGWRSFKLVRPPAVGPRRLVETYGRGCPESGPDHESGSVFCRCDWFERGAALAVLPDWGATSKSEVPFEGRTAPTRWPAQRSPRACPTT